MINPIQALQLITNPAKFLETIINDNQVMSNPMMRNAVNCYKNNDMQGLQNLANNLCQSKGTTLEQVKKQYNL